MRAETVGQFEQQRQASARRLRCVTSSRQAVHRGPLKSPAFAKSPRGCKIAVWTKVNSDCKVNAGWGTGEGSADIFNNGPQFLADRHPIPYITELEPSPANQPFRSGTASRPNSERVLPTGQSGPRQRNGKHNGRASGCASRTAQARLTPGTQNDSDQTRRYR